MLIIALSTAFFVTLAVILATRPLARKLGLMDSPGGRKAHSHDTPLIGGVGIYCGLLAACLLLPALMSEYGPLLGISALLLGTGIVDDYYPLPATVRMGIQVLAAWMMCSISDNQLETLGRLVSSNELFLGQYSILMTIFGTVGVINAINMIDGMDGLSGGMVGICLVMLVIATGIHWNNAPFLHMSLLVLACVMAFLMLNFRALQNKPALIYLGD